MEQSQSRLTVRFFVAAIALTAGACGDNEAQDALYCSTSVDCGIEIDCTFACDHRLAVCAEGCPYANCTRSLSRAGCMQECDEMSAENSVDLFYQCLTAQDTCDTIQECTGTQ